MGRNGIYRLAQVWNLRDQEIVMPAYFHGVEVDTLLAAGARLRFYPVDANMRVRTEDVVALLSPGTRAVYVIHYLGFPGPVEELSEICRKRGLLLIEDCALALLSQLDDKPLGSIGDASVFSLHKTLPLPHGGALVMRNSKALIRDETKRPPLASTLAYTASALWRDLEFEGGFVHNLLRKAKSSSRKVSGSIGVIPVGGERFDLARAHLNVSRLTQWVMANQNYDTIVERRRRNYTHLLDRLRRISPPVFDGLSPGVCPLFYPLRVRNKPEMLKWLFERGVDAINFWSTQPPFVPAGAFPEVECLRRTILELPCHQDLSLKEMDWIADQVCELRSQL
jgi:dTDP-4-amino-4,6-dideoxygalactose transaminase